MIAIVHLLQYSKTMPLVLRLNLKLLQEKRKEIILAATINEEGIRSSHLLFYTKNNLKTNNETSILFLSRFCKLCLQQNDE